MYGYLLQPIARRTASLGCLLQTGRRPRASLTRQFFYHHPYPPVPSVLLHLPPGLGTLCLNPDATLRAVSVTSAELFLVHTVKKSRKISLNQSCRACKRAPCWRKIQCKVQLSSGQTPGGVTVISPASAAHCSVSASGNP